MSVPTEKLYGTYVSSYPFGTETLRLNSDGTFVQTAAIKEAKPVTVRGTWEFDPGESRITLHGSLIVSDGFNHLRSGWDTASTGLDALSVEILWFRVVIGSGLPNPYIKR